MNIDAQFNETGGIFHADMGEEREISDVEQIRAEISTSRAEDKKLYNNLYANALRGAASGSAIRLTDVSPNEHTLGVKAMSKNFIPYPYYATSKTENGITFTVNSDGSINVKGTSTATGDTRTTFFLIVTGKPLNLEVGKQYTLSGFTGADENCGLAMQTTSYTTSIGSNKNTPTKTFIANFDTWYIWIYVNAGATVDTTFYPQLEEGSTATAYTPYISDLSSVNVTRCGKNLIPYPYYNTTKTENGVMFTVNTDGSIALSGASTGQATFYFMYGSLSLKKGTTYTFSASGDYNFSGSATLYIYDSKQGQTAYIPLVTDKKATFTPNVDIKNTNCYIVVPANRTASGTIKVQLELGSTATTYEPCQGQAYTPTATGTVEDVTSISPDMTLMTDTAGITIDCEYNRDINKAFAKMQQAILSMGGNT